MNKYNVLSCEEDYVIEGQGKAGRKVPMKFITNCEILNNVDALSIRDFQDSFSCWWYDPVDNYDENYELDRAFGLETSRSSGTSFKRCRRLFIAASVVFIDPDIFTIMNLSEICISDANPNFCVYDGVLYTKDMKELIYCPMYKNIRQFVVPHNTIVIGKRAFWNNQYIRVCSLNDVDTIEQEAFSFSKIEEILDGNKIERVGAHAFYYCSSLVKTELSDKAVIEIDAFEQCNKLEKK